jgi:hypothetical protein
MDVQPPQPVGLSPAVMSRVAALSEPMPGFSNVGRWVVIILVIWWTIRVGSRFARWCRPRD